MHTPPWHSSMMIHSRAHRPPSQFNAHRQPLVLSTSRPKDNGFTPTVCIQESSGNFVGDSIASAQEMIKVQRKRCFKNPLESPVFVIKVQPNDAQMVRDEFEKDKIGFQTKMSYDASTCKMIFHFLPSDVHNAAVASFDDMLTATLDLLPFNQPARQYKHRGNTTFSMPNSGLKEPDMYLFPTTRKRDPTLVLEVGYSERLSDLRLDAKRWLSRTPQVFLVVLIDINKSNDAGTPPTVTVEHWTGTQSRPYGESVYSQLWTYGNNQDYHISLHYIFEKLPPAFINTNGTAMDLVIPAALVDDFMHDLHDAWVNMPSEGQIVLFS